MKANFLHVSTEKVVNPLKRTLHDGPRHYQDIIHKPVFSSHVAKLSLYRGGIAIEGDSNLVLNLM